MIRKLLLLLGLTLPIVGCPNNTPPPPPPPAIYSLTVESVNPLNGVVIQASPDNNGVSSGTTTFILTYSAGTTVTLTAPTLSGDNTFVGWVGCSVESGPICTMVMNNSAVVTANYVFPTVMAINLPIISAGDCDLTHACVGTVYIMAGACPDVLSGSDGWTIATLSTGDNTFPEPGTFSVTIVNVLPNTEYALDVEAIPVGLTSDFNGPSNCVTVTTPSA